MASALRCTRTMQCSRVSLRKARSMATVVGSHHEAKYTRGPLSTTQCKAKACSNGQMADYISATSSKAKSMVRAHTCGQMAKPMKVSSKMMSVAAMVSFTILTGSASKAIGKRGRSTEAGSISGRTALNTSSLTLTGRRLARAQWTPTLSQSNKSRNNIKTWAKRLKSAKKCSCEPSET